MALPCEAAAEEANGAAMVATEHPKVDNGDMVAVTMAVGVNQPMDMDKKCMAAMEEVWEEATALVVKLPEVAAEVSVVGVEIPVVGVEVNKEVDPAHARIK